MDQSTAQTHLDNWIAADIATAGGKSYTIGNRQFTRNDAEEIRNQITYWQRIVKTAQASLAGKTSPGVRIATWN